LSCQFTHDKPPPALAVFVVDITEINGLVSVDFPPIYGIINVTCMAEQESKTRQIFRPTDPILANISDVKNEVNLTFH